MAPSINAGPVSIAVIVSVVPVSLKIADGASALGSRLIIAIVGVLGRSPNSFAPSLSIRNPVADPLSVALAGVGAKVFSGFLIIGVPSCLCLVIDEPKGVGEHHHHGEDQDKSGTH